VLTKHIHEVFLIIWHPDVDPSRVQAWRSWCIEKLGVGVRVEIKSAESIVFAKVDAEVCAAGIACLSVEKIKVSLVVEVAEAVLDVLIVEVVVVSWEVFCR
jgi:hypothetical protein